jgi:hypothetical protein
MNDESELRELIKDHKHVCTECKVEFTVVWSLCVVPECRKFSVLHAGQG